MLHRVKGKAYNQIIRAPDSMQAAMSARDHLQELGRNLTEVCVIPLCEPEGPVGIVYEPAVSPEHFLFIAGAVKRVTG